MAIKERVKGLARVLSTVQKAQRILESTNKRLVSWGLAAVSVPNTEELARAYSRGFKPPRKVAPKPEPLSVGDLVSLTDEAKQFFLSSYPRLQPDVKWLVIQNVTRRGSHNAAPYVYSVGTPDGTTILVGKADLAKQK